MTDFFISVIVPTLNPGPLLDRALASIRAQGPIVREILMIDGGSSSLEYTDVAEPKVRVLGGPGVSLVEAWNLGLNSAVSPWIAFLDSDDYWFPGSLAAHEQALNRALLVTGSPHSACTGRIRYESSERRLPAQFRAHLLNETPLGWMPGSTIVRTSVAREIGPFQKDLGVASDIEWIARLREFTSVVTTDHVVLAKSVRAASVSMESSVGGTSSGYSQDLLRLARQRVTLHKSGDQAQ